MTTHASDADDAPKRARLPHHRAFAPGHATPGQSPPRQEQGLPLRPGPAAALGAPARLAIHGAAACSAAELLAVLLGRGGRMSAEEGAWRLLRSFGTLRALARASAQELATRAGITPRRARCVSAGLALGLRVATEPLARGQVLTRSAEIFEAFHLRMRDAVKERFLAVHLNAKNRVLGESLVSEGILTASLVHPREVFEPAIRVAAAGVVLIHNHPSGDPEPSPEDLEVTRRLVAVGEIVGIRIFDHIVIGDGVYVSFLERGLL